MKSYLLFNLMLVLIISFGSAFFLTIGQNASAEQSAEQSTTASQNNTQCVAPIPVMRRNHMLFILHQRDKTVHEGVRTQEHSLVGCINCHAKKDNQGNFVTVDNSDHFCRGCHDRAAVQIDCFQCHNSKPEQISGMHESEVSTVSKQYSIAHQGVARP